MNKQDILEEIVVAISRDGKKRCGTGFYITEDKVATCYHVLVLDGGRLETKYWIKHDKSEGWIEAQPIKCCPLPDDIAILQSTEKNDAASGSIFGAFGAPSEFHSKGYDEKLAEFGATWVGGSIAGFTYLEDSGARRRLQLSTPVEAIKGGRSGSPVFSTTQQTIVGMIDYRRKHMHRDADIVTAIPIEAVIPLAIPPRSIHFEEDSQRLDEDQRRTQLESRMRRIIEDRIYYRQNELKNYEDLLLLETDKEKLNKLQNHIKIIKIQLDADIKEISMMAEVMSKSTLGNEDQAKQSRD